MLNSILLQSVEFRGAGPDPPSGCLLVNICGAKDSVGVGVCVVLLGAVSHWPVDGVQSPLQVFERLWAYRCPPGGAVGCRKPPLAGFTDSGDTDGNRATAPNRLNLRFDLHNLLWENSNPTKQ